MPMSLPKVFQPAQVLGVSPIGLCDEPSVEAPLTPAGFIAGDKNDRGPDGVKREGGSPFAIATFKSQFLHVHVFGSIECVHMRTSELWPIIDE
jgi:hypothetical protein